MLDLVSFRHQLLRCFDNNVPEKLMVALSGGVDSMCLTYLLSQYKNRYHPSLSIHAITIDHDYRSGSEEEALNVGDLVRRWGVHHLVFRLSYDKHVATITNFEEVARNMRYSVFRNEGKRLGIRSLLVGHTLDDRIETMLQRLQMNSTLYGLDGLKCRSAIPLPRTDPHSCMSVIRPLLPFEKSELQSVCTSNGVEWHEDHTNLDRWLTKRNLLRYMVNEHVPRHEPNALMLSKASLKESIAMLDGTINTLEAKTRALDKFVAENGNLAVEEKNATVTFSVPATMWSNIEPLVAARWLYFKAAQVSPSKHMHWSYAKIERRALPRIDEFVSGEERETVMTYMNVVFKIARDGENLHFQLSKQLPIRADAAALSQNILVEEKFSPWILYDRTWWVRLKCSGKSSVTILPYTLQMRKSLMEAFTNLEVAPPGNLTVPIVVDSNSGDIVALPTYGLVRANYEVECVLKEPEVSLKST